MNTQVIQFVWRGELVALPNVPPSSTLLQMLRDNLNCTGYRPIRDAAPQMAERPPVHINEIELLL